MRFILKILFLPIRVFLWAVTGVLTLLLKISSVILIIGTVVFALAGIVQFFAEKNIVSGICCIVIAFLCSPYGLPQLAAMLIAPLYALREAIREKIYC